MEAPWWRGARWRAALGILLLGVVICECGAGCGAGGRAAPPVASPGAQWQPEASRRRPLALTRPLRVGIRVGTAAVRVRAVPDGAGGAAGAAPDTALAGARGPLVLLAGPAGRALGWFGEVTLHPAGGGVRVVPGRGAARSFSDTLRLLAPPGAVLAVDGTAYRGELEAYLLASGALALVDRVGLEDYLLGVVPLEIGAPGPAAREAVKAQAVAARTYALTHLERWPEQGFDVYGDVRDQVYGGRAAEHPAISAAVRETAGLVATYDGLMISTFYSACCGGVLAAAHETWAFPPQPYLMSHRDRLGMTDLCASSRHYRWQERWTADAVVALMAAYYQEEFGGAVIPTGPLERIEIDGRCSSGRVRSMRVTTGGHTFRMGGDRIRWVLRRGGAGGAILRSSQIELSVERQDGQIAAVVAYGAGNGHGAGMCQAGALEMAREGHGFEEILRHYYPGTQLARLWSV